jgi:AmmeMemoRadiSam system protein B
MTSKTVRNPAVAGMFYPAEPARLRATVEQYLQSAESRGPVPKAIIAPHAGYVYSGPIAASAYARLAPAADIIKRVVLLGPAHRVSFRGLALPSCQRFMTPLGAIPVDQEAVAKVVQLPQVLVMDDAHVAEHSLEVHLPFLQIILSHFALVPLAVGEASAIEVGEVLECLWGGSETLIVISSDLSHYYDYETARHMDSSTSHREHQVRASLWTYTHQWLVAHRAQAGHARPDYRFA